MKMRKANTLIYHETILLDSIVAFLKMCMIKMTRQTDININVAVKLQDSYNLV